MVAAVVLVFFLIERRRSKTGFYGTKAEVRTPPIMGAAAFGGVFLETDAGNVLVILPVFWLLSRWLRGLFRARREAQAAKPAKTK